MLERYIDLLLTRRWLVLVLAVLVVIAAGAGGRYIAVSQDFRDIIGNDNPQLAAYDALENTYSTANYVLVAIAPGGGTVFSREALVAIEELTEAAWRTPYSNRVDSLSNYFHTRALTDELIVESLVNDAHSLDSADLRRIKQIALQSNDLAGRLVAHDGRTAGMVISFAMPEPQGKAVEEITGYLEQMLDDARTRHPDTGYYVTGNVILNDSITNAAKYFLETLLPIAVLIISVGTALLLRSVFATVATIAVVMFAIITTMGLSGWFRTVLDPTTSGLPIIIMAIAIAHSVHLASATLANIASGKSRKAAVADSIRINAWPVFLTSVTTMIGFLSLNTSNSPSFQVLGNLVALGIFCTFFFSMTLLPVLLSLLPLKRRNIFPDRVSLFEWLGDFVVERRKSLIWFVLVVTVLLLSGIPRLEFSDNWTTQFDERYQFRRDTDFISNNLTGLNSMDYSLESGREGGVTDPEYLHKVETFAQWFREQPETAHVRAFSDVMKRLNRNMNEDKPEFYRLPDNAELAAQYLLLYELSVPFGADLNDRIDVAKSSTRLTATVRGISASELKELDQRAESWLRANIPQFAAKATGMTMVFAYLTQQNLESMLKGTMIGMALISLILILVFRSLRLGLISLVPNFFPAAIAFGLWGHLVGQVGLAGTVMTVIAFGIVVDDTIHFMSKYLRARRQSDDAQEAVRAAFRKCGHALLTTTIALSAGFLVFASSGYEGSATLGLMVTLAIISALIIDFLLLPPLLIVLDHKIFKTRR